MKNNRSKWKCSQILTGDNVRSQYIRPNMIGTEIYAYDGKKFKTLKISIHHVGHKIGEFVHSKIIYKKDHGKKVKN